MHNRVDSKRIRKTKRNKINFYLFIAVLCVAILYMVVYLLSDLDRFLIEGVRIEGNESVSESAFHDSVINSIFERRLLFPDKSYLTLNKSRFKKILLEEYKIFKDIELSFKNNIVNVQVIERDPVGMWCYEEEDVTLGELCHFFDKDGVLYGHASSFSGGTYLKIVSVAPAKFFEYGDIFMAKDKVLQFQDLVNLLETRSIEIEAIEIYDIFDIKVLISSMYGQNVKDGAFLFIDRRDLDTEARDFWLLKALTALSRSSDFIEELFSKSNSFEYVDLRFRGRLYYRF